MSTDPASMPEHVTTEPCDHDGVIYRPGCENCRVEHARHFGYPPPTLRERVLAAISDDGINPEWAQDVCDAIMDSVRREYAGAKEEHHAD
ncbi:MAG: hypothetical protein AVDCRST_MAG68-2094 [uncultured Gemmatimonadetes bacterium]|uniref:Uncharacterized protein n=1 Tax=uncultured Gemmatimonadota bacterium TaxID=203437 RepID=A0A6J4L5B0_9BACT|nr:MAG: hypothetical protein AVDCRST_MAG68-2094 [uncultured Gemmatimonadota bacterium]